MCPFVFYVCVPLFTRRWGRDRGKPLSSAMTLPVRGSLRTFAVRRRARCLLRCGSATTSVGVPGPVLAPIVRAPALVIVLAVFVDVVTRPLVTVYHYHLLLVVLFVFVFFATVIVLVFLDDR